MKPGSTEITMDYRNQPDLTGNDRLKRRLGLISSLIPGPSLNQFLIDFGLNLASGVPRGNILATAAASAREPLWTVHATTATNWSNKSCSCIRSFR